MKKLILSLAFIGLFSFMTPMEAAPPSNDCTTKILVCSDGTEHYVVVCDIYDVIAWIELLCGEEL